jgi:hypothetical protein
VVIQAETNPGATRPFLMASRCWLDRSLRGITRRGTPSRPQQLLPADREEIADQERLSWTLQKFPPQPSMNEIYWQYSKDAPAFFRASLVQFVARTYLFSRDNFDGSKSLGTCGHESSDHQRR